MSQSPASKAINRTAKGTWAPGQSGNASGRPKADMDVAAMARAHTPEAIAALVEALNEPKERVGAASILLDRGWGKATQPVDVHGGDSITMLHLIAARAIADQMQALLLAGKLTNGSSNGHTEPPVIDLNEPALE